MRKRIAKMQRWKVREGHVRESTRAERTRTTKAPKSSLWSSYSLISLPSLRRTLCVRKKILNYAIVRWHRWYRLHLCDLHPALTS